MRSPSVSNALAVFLTFLPTYTVRAPDWQEGEGLSQTKHVFNGVCMEQRVKLKRLLVECFNDARKPESKALQIKTTHITSRLASSCSASCGRLGATQVKHALGFINHSKL